MACFMGLVSFLASRHEVLRIDTWNRKVRKIELATGTGGRAARGVVAHRVLVLAGGMEGHRD